MKGSSTTSARATGLARPAGRSSDRQPSLTTAEFVLDGPSNTPDPATNAFRKDLADIVLAGRVLASHYAQAVTRTLASATALREQPSEDAPVIAELNAGDPFEMLDDSVGWAWGYGGAERRVGYVRSAALSAGG